MSATVPGTEGETPAMRPFCVATTSALMRGALFLARVPALLAPFGALNGLLGRVDQKPRRLMARLTPKTRPASGAILCSARQIEALSVPTSQPMKPWVTWQR